MGTKRKVISTFEDLSLSQTMMEALRRAGYEKPSPVQAGTIPWAIYGYDVVGQARTGTGKTAAFVIPILEQLDLSGESQTPQAIVMVPTRELAVQVHDEFVKLAHGRQARCLALYGGQPIRQQLTRLKQRPQVIVGTPGRILDHIGRRSLDLREIWCAVLDEADRMLDIGFRPDIERILRSCPKDRQTLLLSATIPDVIRRLADRYMDEPKFLNFSPKKVAHSTIEQFYFTVHPSRKFELLLKLLEREKPKQAIIFCRTKRGTERIHLRLKKQVDDVACIHGDMQQSARNGVMQRFRDGKLTHLVATDVVGRGIDVTGVSHIINYDVPEDCDDYVHRVGRTGRMGREGVAYSFIVPGEGEQLTKIEQRINRLLIEDKIEDFDPTCPARVETAPGPKPPPPPDSLMKRPPKRYRRW